MSSHNFRNFKFRKPAKELAYRRRHLALTSNEQVRLRTISGVIKFLTMKQMIKPKEFCEREKGLLKSLYATYLSIVYLSEKEELPEIRPDYTRTISSFTPSNCYIFFHFRRRELHRFFPLLQFPDVCVLENNSAMAVETLFLRGLYELVTAENALLSAWKRPIFAVESI